MARREKLAILLKKLAAEFLSRERNSTALITVSMATTSADLKRATILITVLPETKEAEILAFTKQKRSALRDVLKKTLRVKNVPFIDFEIDRGEKNRQKIDELLQNDRI